MTTFVTGGTGFVGSAAGRRLVDAGHAVLAFARPQSNLNNLQGLPVEIVTGDLCDRGSLDRALRGCDVLFHVAADYRLWARDSQSLYRANVTGTENAMLSVLQAGVKRIIYTSSVATLGWAPEGGWPTRPRGSTKRT